MTADTTSRPPQTAGAGGDKIRRIVLAVVSVLAVIALVAAAWFGFGWGRALLADRPTADARDAALSGAMQAAINLNSVDAADVDRSIENMRSSITGEALNNDLAATEQQIRQQVAQTGTGMSANVLFGSLTALDTDANTANALIVLAVKTTWPDNFVENKVTVNVAMRKDGDIWKAETIQPLDSVQLGGGPVEGAQQPAPPADPAPAPGAPAPAPADPGSAGGE
ncbi:hypothetical protein QLG13_19650 [Rhodococcus aetherivorans]|nr:MULTISPECIES: hypothetical protein [Rhodococcus]NCL75409.1 hypothetical protein [Rhodococcus sp. YH1]WFS15345.1 hypothetical protein P9K37_09985 [Rhodococcus aetherivorans]WKW97220.1 hypothetical protein Q3O43_19525 [Rhodococcus aetherivorans]